MRRVVVDTNVPIVANGRRDGAGEPSIACRLAAVEFLEMVLARGRIVVDQDGAIQSEYRKYLNPRGQPGVGDRFYLEVINSAPARVERVALPKGARGNYLDFPLDSALKRFDKGDRKFAALARRERIPVANATDSDWLEHDAALRRNGIKVQFICGCDTAKWFQP
jgi:hypothetical protein